MYVTRSRTYYVGSEQHTARASYLVLASTSTIRDSDDHETLYAVVRKVALSQCGQFMMGSARIGDSQITISGAYGSDSLPIDFDRLTPGAQSKFRKNLVPQDVARAYWQDAPNANDLMRRYAQSLIS